MKSISKAIVTGGAGFIGSHIVDELLKRRIETWVVDDLSTGSLENLKEHRNNKLLHVLVGDTRNMETLLPDEKDIDVVFHEAAIASVPRSVSEPMVVHDINVNVSLAVMNFCINRGVKRFIFASSSAVYGRLDQRFHEGLVCRPYSPYAASKLAIENYLTSYFHTYGLESVALRYFNVFGPRQIMNDYSGVIMIFINQLLKGQTPTIFGDGTQTRDFVYVKDVVQANMLAMESENVKDDVFNVATGNSITILELLQKLKSITKTENIKHKFSPPRRGDVIVCFTSIDKIKNSLGYESKMSMSEGLANVVEFIKSQTPTEIGHKSNGGTKFASV